MRIRKSLQLPGGCWANIRAYVRWPGCTVRSWAEFQTLLQLPYAMIPGGNGAVASDYGQHVHASGAFATPGDAQTSTFVLRGLTTNSTQVALSLDGAGNKLNIANNRVVSFHILISAAASTGQAGAWKIEGAIENEPGSMSFLVVPTITTLGVSGISGWVNIGLNSASDYMDIL